MHEAADAADPLDDEAHLRELDAVHHGLQAAVDVADGRDRVNDLLVLEQEVKDDWLRQDRVLRPERDDGPLHAFFTDAAAAAAAVASTRAFTAEWEKGILVAVLYNCPCRSRPSPVTSIPKSSRISFS